MNPAIVKIANQTPEELLTAARTLDVIAKALRLRARKLRMGQLKFVRK